MDNGCHFSTFASLVNSSDCTTFNETTCAMAEYSRFYGKGNYHATICFPQCPLECNSTQITYTTTSYELLGDAYVDYKQKNPNLKVDFINNTITPDLDKKSMVRLFIY